MYGIVHFPLFLTTCLILSATPGPSMMYLLSRTLSQGRNVGWLSVLGVSTGTLIHVVFAAAGLSAILATSAAAFTIVKVAGAGYLIFLGVKAILAKTDPEATEEKPKPVGNAYRQGMITQVLNPKLAAFMISFLPQFVAPNATGPAPFFALGLFFAALDTVLYMSLVAVAAKAASTIHGNEKLMDNFKRWAGVVYIGLGLNLLRAQRAR